MTKDRTDEQIIKLCQQWRRPVYQILNRIQRAALARLAALLLYDKLKVRRQIGLIAIQTHPHSLWQELNTLQQRAEEVEQKFIEGLVKNSADIDPDMEIQGDQDMEIQEDQNMEKQVEPEMELEGDNTPIPGQQPTTTISKNRVHKQRKQLRKYEAQQDQASKLIQIPQPLPPHIVGLSDFPDISQILPDLEPIPKIARAKPNTEPEPDKLGSPSTYEPIRPRSKQAEQAKKYFKRQIEEQQKKVQ